MFHDFIRGSRRPGATSMNMNIQRGCHHFVKFLYSIFPCLIQEGANYPMKPPEEGTEKVLFIVLFILLVIVLLYL